MADGKTPPVTGMFAPLHTGSYLRLWLGSGVVSLAVMGQGVAPGWPDGTLRYWTWAKG